MTVKDKLYINKKLNSLKKQLEALDLVDSDDDDDLDIDGNKIDKKVKNTEQTKGKQTKDMLYMINCLKKQ
jgi:hypothetical protein